GRRHRPQTASFPTRSSSDRNEYVTSAGEWGDWATIEGSGGGEGPTPPHEHSFGGWKNNGTQHWKECSCGEKSEESPHNFGEWELDRKSTRLNSSHVSISYAV